MPPPFVADASLTSAGLAASSPQGLADRRELSAIAVERTRMPMVVTDPRQPDNPIVLANAAFLGMSGYTANEVIGRNCRFMQGPATQAEALDEVRAGITAACDVTVELINYRKDGSTFWNQLFISPIHDDNGELVYFFASQMDTTRFHTAVDLEAAERRLLREVDHRAKNVLALVQGIVRLSRADDPLAYAKAVQGRVQALAQAHSMLSEGRWRHVPLNRLIEAQVEPYGRSRVTLEGGGVNLSSSQVQPLALVVHEMLDNAERHGALSGETGSLTIRWHAEPDDSAADRRGDIVIEMCERGGPAAPQPPANGFGLKMLDAIVKRQLGGRAALDWHADGLTSKLTIPVDA